MAALVVLPCPLENCSQMWAAPADKVGGWFGASSTLVQILWMISRGMLFRFQEKLCFMAKDLSSHHVAVPCTKQSDFLWPSASQRTYMRICSGTSNTHSFRGATPISTH